MSSASSILRLECIMMPNGSRCRVAGRRGNRGTIKELGSGSSPPPNIPDVRISRIRLKEQALDGSLPGPPWTEPRKASSLLPPHTMTASHGSPASACWPCRPSSQPAPRGASLLRFVITAVIATTASCVRLPSTCAFPDSAVIALASRTTDVPRLDHASVSWCRRPYAGRLPECIRPGSSSGTLAFAYPRAARHLPPPQWP
jgi:hypothetical protein